jgi:hypothetical protein
VIVPVPVASVAFPFIERTISVNRLLVRLAASTRCTCACRKLNPAILVMQSAQGWATQNVPGAIDEAAE